METPNIQLLIYKRLLFELGLLRQESENIIKDKIKHIEELETVLKNTQKNFYVISNNLYST